MKKNKIINWIKKSIYVIGIFLAYVSVAVKEMQIGMIITCLFIQNMSIIRVYDATYGKRYEDRDTKGHYFPAEMMCTAKHFKPLFRYAHIDIDWVPKIAVYHMYTTVGTIIVFDILILVALIVKHTIFRTAAKMVNIAIILLVFLYMMIMLVTGLAFDITATKKAFIYKFKKINRRNFKYLLWRILFIDPHKNEPPRKVLGKCSVLSVRKRGRKKYADVKLLRDGTLYKKVLAQDEKCSGSVKLLQDICGVKYISG